MSIFDEFLKLAREQFNCPCCSKPTAYGSAIYSTVTSQFYCADCFIKLHNQGKA